MAQVIAASTERVRIASVWKVFRAQSGPLIALEDVSINVRDGEFLCIVGPSGCGKTTLLRMLAGLEQQTAGQVHIQPGEGNRPLRSVVFQEQSIFPWMNVRDNVAYGLRMRDVRGRALNEPVDYYLERVGLTQFARAFPHQLSGGMKQRVSLARAFANDPEVLLMDEPFAALDEQTKLVLQEELLRLWGEQRKTVIFITHGIDEAVFLADRILVMTARPGRVKALIDVPFTRPRSLFDMRADARYGELTAEIWRALREEVVRAGTSDPSA
ncbi:MAG: ABC transporter ATP-binding protein [Chloroflexi bacterium]|nr:ABC transporter ATP-binding protein [Chloroflexota bacterium]